VRKGRRIYLRVVPDPVVDVRAWQPWSPHEVAVRLRSVGVAWAVAGGWALDLFVGGAAHPHGDIEIVVAREQLVAVQSALPELDWFAVAGGKMLPAESAPGRGHQTWGWDREAACWRVDVMREPWDEAEWVYRRNEAIRRPLAGAIERTADGVPYLAPELVLLFKATEAREKDERDFARLLPLLDERRRQWLASALQTAHPGHAWVSALDPGSV